MSPTVSVIILNWNRGELLREAVESVLAQTWRDFEVIVVDNGSVDGSIAALRAAVSDERLRIEELGENRGIAAGTNHGLRLGRGRFLALLDSDDRCHPRRLELQVAALEADPGLMGVGSDAQRIDPAGRPAGELRLMHDPDEVAGYARYNMPLHHPSLMYRRELFDHLAYRGGLFLAADFDFIARAVEAGHRFAALPLLLCDHRIHPGSSTLKWADKAKVCTATVRMANARRAAGRDEDLAGLIALQDRALAEETPVWRHYLMLAALGRREDGHVTACLHAALAVRERPALRTAVAYGWTLLGALWREPRAAWLALAGGVKGPFWLLLKRRGFPAFPRY